MSYCINPNCSDRWNPHILKNCQNCGSCLTICDRYRIIKPLRGLNGQHHTEIFEIDDCGTSKILKVLTRDRRRLVELFEQESKILAQLQHLPVAQLDTHFTFVPQNSDQELRCIVMKKVEGKNLKEWLLTNNKLSEKLAKDWLRQLVSILAQVHQEQILHRDIKPSNIMIRPDGKLILIDFGTARKLNQTYIEKLEDGEITRIYSPGYTAPEQLRGQAVDRSDLFALGRTLIHLITGIYPDKLPKTEINQLLWRDQAPQISLSLANLIDTLIAISPTERPQASEILEQLSLSNNFQALKFWLKHLAKDWQRSLSLILVSSIAIAGLVMGIRSLGLLQPLELPAFDRLMQLRPLETPDSRLLLITINEADIQYQNQQQMSMRWSLSDEALAQLLAKINPYQPRTIGIDIYRDFTVDPNYPYLAKELQTNNHLLAACKLPASQDGTVEGTPPPPEVPLERIGFSDFVADRGDMVRRQLVHLTPPTDSLCTAEYAFNLELALNYLRQQGIESNVTSEGYLQINQATFKPINQNSGGYQTIDAAGYQFLLNYRSLHSPTDIAQQISLRDILSDRFDNYLPDLIKDRLVIIGVTASSSADDWQTPYSCHTPGIFVQAQMVSHILSTVLDHRPLFWWWSNFWEIIWIGGWSLLGGIMGWYLRRPLWLGIAIAFSLLLLFVSCWAILLQAGWIPLIPAILGFLLAALTAVLFKSQKPKVKAFYWVNSQ
jgi:CHASE2 domain-containing sensor protein/predicted Ser/Thr protein kinase